MGIRKQAFVRAGILAVLLLVSVAAVSTAAEIKILTTGVQPISGGDTSEARQAAISSALQQAVGQAFAQMVPPRVFADNLVFLYDRTVSGAEEYIVTFRVLGEIAHQNKYLVGVESHVDSGMLEQTLKEAGIFGMDADHPRVLLLIAEQTAQDPLPRYWWGNHPEPYFSHAEIRIADLMKQKRFNVIEWGPERPDPRAQGIRFQSIYDPEAALDLAKSMGADLVVLGRAGAAESINRMANEKIFEGTVRLNAFDVTTGDPVAESAHQIGAKAGDDRTGDVQAIVQAADLAAADLAGQIDRFWTQKQRKKTTFDVRIEGDQLIPRFIALKKRFAEIREIETVQPREIGSDQAVLEMVYQGGPDQFADRIMLKTFDGFGIEVVELTDTLVSLRFVEGPYTGGIEESAVPDSSNEKTSE